MTEFYLTHLHFSKVFFDACRVRTKVLTGAVCPTVALLATTVRILMRTLLATALRWIKVVGVQALDFVPTRARNTYAVIEHVRNKRVAIEQYNFGRDPIGILDGIL